MKLICGKKLKTSLLILMTIIHSSSLTRVSYVLMSPYPGGTYRFVIGSFCFCRSMWQCTGIWRRGGIHNYACGWLGIMMRLGIVKSSINEEDQEDNEDNIPHITTVLKELVMPWANTESIA